MRGKGFFAAEKFPNGKDHPRLCGEKPVCKAVSTASRGSPPPMRGKVTRYNVPNNFDGITPAYAGKSHQLVNYIIDSKDHPRLCGEKAVNTCMHAGNFRITPAYAGKSQGVGH